VDRGGSYASDAQYDRVAYRYDYTPEHRYFNLGFRLVCK
jgi:formylglycine-generating enzyme required for sulfatase activity